MAICFSVISWYADQSYALSRSYLWRTLPIYTENFIQWYNSGRYEKYVWCSRFILSNFWVAFDHLTLGIKSKFNHPLCLKCRLKIEQQAVVFSTFALPISNFYCKVSLTSLISLNTNHHNNILTLFLSDNNASLSYWLPVYLFGPDVHTQI